MSIDQDSSGEVRMDPDALYREETIGDQRAGSIRCLTPVTTDGNPDPKREVRYVGQAQILTPMGALPLSFEIPANSLREAVEGFAEEAKGAVERTAREIEEMRREAASSIVIPKSGGGVGPGGMPGGGLPGGGIQMP